MENNKPYLAPTSSMVANLILHTIGIGTDTCEWLIDDTTIAKQPCDGPAIAKNVKYDVEHKLEVRPSSGAPQSVKIVLKDILIVSLGDSFSAGEGNPERPVTLRDDTYYNYGASSPGREFPVRLRFFEDVELRPFQQHAAGWSNVQCHRSLYSQHTRAALQYALEHPHFSVTFLNYSCTGAAVYEGILNAWWGRENDANVDYDDAPQLVKALRDLCKNAKPYQKTKWAYSRNDKDYDKVAKIPECKSLIRDVDVLLLSIGGNDVGFANIIAGSMLNDKYDGQANRARPWVYGLWRKISQPKNYKDGLTSANSEIPKRYKMLDNMLHEYLGLTSGKIILSAYPQLSYDASGNLCKAGNLGLDVHGIFGADAQAFPGARDFVKEFHEIMESAAKARGWRFADQHIAQDGAPNNFTKDGSGIGHGICAEGAADSEEIAIHFPQPSKGEPPYDWEPFQPRRWKPYSSRNRWFVTPNDAFLTTNYHDTTIDLIDSVQPVLAATLSGSFHPNALGHAAVADSVLIRLREVFPAYEN